MFKKFKNVLNEVTEEVKQNPRFQNLNQLAAQTYSSMNGDEGIQEDEGGTGGQNNQESTAQFFSLGGVDGEESSPKRPIPNSVKAEAAGLFPIYESPPTGRFPSFDAESTTEWEGESSSSLSAVTKEQLLNMLQKSRSRYHKYKGRYVDVLKAYQDLQAENQKITNVMQQTQDKALRRIAELREQSNLEQKAKRHLEEELRSDMEEKEHIIKTLETKVTLLKSGIEAGKTEEDSNNLADSNNSDQLVIVDIDESPMGRGNAANNEKVLHLEEKVKRLENLLTKCKESITANKQKINALVEVKESLSQQLSEKTDECAEIQTRYDSETSRLSRELDDARISFEKMKTKDQNEELQIAESKLVMHQEILTKDEEISKLRLNLKTVSEEKDSAEKTIGDLKSEIKQLTAAQKTLERTLEDEKAAAMQEISRGKTEALQALRAEMDEEQIRLVQKLTDEKKDMNKKHENEIKAKTDECLSEKKRELKILEDRMRAALIEKGEENRLALEEAELRIKSMTNADKKKSELLRDLESKLKASNQDRQTLEKRMESNKFELSELKTFKDEIQSKSIERESTLKSDIESLKSHNSANLAAIEEAHRTRAVLEAQIEAKEATIRELEEGSNTNHESLERRYYSESLPEMIQGKDDEIARLKEDSALEIKIIKEELNSLKLENEELKRRIQGESASCAVLEEKQEEVKRLEEELGNLLKAKQDLEKSFNDFKTKKKQEEESIQKNQQIIIAEVINRKEEDIKALSLESSNEIEKLKKQLHKLKMDSETEVENLKSAHEMNVSKRNEEEKARVAEVNQKHLEELEELRCRISELKEGKNVEFCEKNAELQKTVNSLNEELSSITTEFNETVLQRDKLQKILEEKLQEMDKFKEEKKKFKEREISINELEKENATLKERERSQKELEAQMIQYGKELQSKIKKFEDLNEEKNVFIEDLKAESNNKSQEISSNAEKFDRQISDLKVDLEMKIRLERERETAHTELKRQSIEYQKKLQEQIQEKEALLSITKQEVVDSEDKIINLNNLHSKEIEHLTSRIGELSEAIRVVEEGKQENSLKLEEALRNSKNHEELILSLREENLNKSEEIRKLEDLGITHQNAFEEREIELKRDLREELEAKEIEIVHLKSSLDSRNVEVKTTCDNLTQEVSLKNEEICSLQSSYKSLNDEVEVLKRRIYEERSSYEEMQINLQVREKDIELLKKDNTEYCRKIEELESQIGQTSSIDEKIKSLIKEYEKKLAEKEEEREVEIDRILDEHEIETSKLEQRQRECLSEKVSAFESEKTVLEGKVEELSAKVMKLEEENVNSSWGGWDHDELVDLQRNRKPNEDVIEENSIATLKISNNNNHRPTPSFGFNLEEAAEYEYLKNILYQYMLGKEPMTLAKVLATVVKFDTEQINKILVHEAKKTSILSSFGMNHS